MMIDAAWGLVVERAARSRIDYAEQIALCHGGAGDPAESV